MKFERHIRTTEDFPKPGVRFYDFTPLLAEPSTWGRALDELADQIDHFGSNPDRVIAIESKGFILGTALADRLCLPLTLIRKPGLTPGPTREVSFTKEYGEAAYELSRGAVPAGDRALLAYDILAGPGASRAAQQLVEMEGAEIALAAYLIELRWLGGREQLSFPVCSLTQFREAGE